MQFQCAFSYGYKTPVHIWCLAEMSRSVTKSRYGQVAAISSDYSYDGWVQAWSVMVHSSLQHITELSSTKLTSCKAGQPNHILIVAAGWLVLVHSRSIGLLLLDAYLQSQSLWQLTSYLNQAQVPRSTNVCQYWTCNQFLLVEVAARQYISAPTTSVAGEQLFSSAGQLYADRYHTLKLFLAQTICICSGSATNTDV